MQIFVIVASLLLLASLVGFIYYCIKGGNMIVGLFITATFWLLLGMTHTVWTQAAAGNIKSFADGWNIIVGNINGIYSGGPIGYGTTTAVIIFASWFGRVIVDTGIAKSLIKKVVELSGDKQVVTVLTVSVVTALLFTSVFGPGSVMAFGAIVLPILLTIGVNKKLAVGSFLMAVAAGMYVNNGYIVQFSEHPLFKALFQDTIFTGNFTLFSWIAFGIHVLVMIGFILFSLYLSKDKIKAWSMSDDHLGGSDSEEDVPGYTFIVPFIPVILSLIIVVINMIIGKGGTQLTEFAAITSFVIGIFFGLLLTGNLKSYRKAVETTQKTLFNGISDVALLIGMLLVLNMFSTAASTLAAPIIQQALGNSMNWVSNNPIIIVLIFIALAPLALFRGPFMIWGSGIALASVLAIFIPAASPLLLVLFYVQPVGLVAQSCPTQSWGMWSLSYTKYDANEYIKTNLPWAWAITAINILVAFLILM